MKSLRTWRHRNCQDLQQINCVESALCRVVFAICIFNSFFFSLFSRTRLVLLSLLLLRCQILIKPISTQKKKWNKKNSEFKIFELLLHIFCVCWLCLLLISGLVMCRVYVCVYSVLTLYIKKNECKMALDDDLNELFKSKHIFPFSSANAGCGRCRVDYVSA